ncbi:MAG: phytanoyl-CoA dioxygenase family protein [Pseudomonadota bacterium]
MEPATIERLARDLNPDFVLDQDWLARSESMDNRDAYLDVVGDLLQSEASHTFFEPGHFKSTLPNKAVLSHDLSTHTARLLGEVFPDRVASGVAGGVLGETAPLPATLGKEISENGFAVLPDRLSGDTCAAMMRTFDGFTFTNRITGETLTGAEIVAQKDTLSGAWWIDDMRDLAAQPLLQALALDPSILSVAQDVLGTQPIHVQTNCWWTFPNRHKDPKQRAKAESRNAQQFHQDQEFVTFLKLFLYLTDVTDERGPHIYVRGSTQDYEARLGDVEASKRWSDEDIDAAFGRDRIESITGGAGQLALVNTRGYHKGAPVKEGHRLLVQIEYASSMYFNPVKPFDETCLGPEASALRAQHPRIFQNYRPKDVVDRIYAESAQPKPKKKKSLLSKIGKSLGLRG